MPFDKILFANAPLEIINCYEDENYPKPDEFLEKGYCLFLNGTNVTNSGFNFEKTSFITKEKDELLMAGKLKKGDVVLIIKSHFKNNMGDVAFYGENIEFKNIRINSNMVILRTKDDLLSQFLYYFLQSNYFKKQIHVYKFGLAFARPFLSMSALKNIELYFPKLNQQRDIVNFISLFDKKIDLYKKINKNLEEQIKTIYNSFFLYYDDFSLDDLKETEIGLIPKQWDLVSLGEVTTEIKEEIGNNKYKILSVSDSGNLSISEYLNKTIYPIEKYLLVKQKTFAYDPYRIIGGFIGMNVFDFDGCVKPRFIVFKVEEEYEIFMSMFFKSKRFNQWVNNLSSGSVQKLNYNDFSMIKIAFPPRKLIKKFNIIYRNYYDMIMHNNSIMNKLEEIKGVLLSKLISGEMICHR